MRALILALPLLAVSSLELPVPSVAESPISFTSFDVPGADEAQSLFVPALNDEGVVTGAYATTAGTTVGFIRSPTGRFRTLVMNPNDTEGQTVLRSINDAGVIAGFYDVTVPHGFVLVSNDYVPFDVPGAAGGTLVRGINDRGDLAGSFQRDSASDPVGFIALHDGTLVTFRHPQGSGIVVGKINEKRAVTGYVTDGAGVIRGFVRSMGGAFSDVSVTGAVATLAYELNDCSIVAGFYVDEDSGVHGFYGPPGDLRSLDLPGALATKARGINNHGRITGEYVDGNGLRHGFVTAPIANAACLQDD